MEVDQGGLRTTDPIFAMVAFIGLGGVKGFGGLIGFGLICFRRACVAGNGLIRLIPGTAFLSANHKPSCTSACRIAMYSVKVIMPYLGSTASNKRRWSCSRQQGR